MLNKGNRSVNLLGNMQVTGNKFYNTSVAIGIFAGLYITGRVKLGNGKVGIKDNKAYVGEDGSAESTDVHLYLHWYKR